MALLITQRGASTIEADLTQSKMVLTSYLDDAEFHAA
jgi:hypothetical protein